MNPLGRGVQVLCGCVRAPQLLRRRSHHQPVCASVRGEQPGGVPANHPLQRHRHPVQRRAGRGPGELPVVVIVAAVAATVAVVFVDVVFVDVFVAEGPLDWVCIAVVTVRLVVLVGVTLFAADQVVPQQQGRPCTAICPTWRRPDRNSACLAGRCRPAL